MAPISSRAFARGLRRLDPEEFAAFVADLYRARGADVRIEDGEVVVDDGGRERRLAVHHAGRLPSLRRAQPAASADADPDADTTVTTARRPRSGIGAEDLREMVLYAIDPDAADDLLREYLGRPARVDAQPREFPTVDPGRAVAVAGAVLLLAVAVGYAGLAPPGGTTETAGTATPIPPDETPDTRTPGTARAGEFTLYPPGIDGSGVTDTDALARAHLRALSGNSYEFRIEHTQYVNDASWLVRIQIVDVEEPDVYVSFSRRHSEFHRAIPLFADAPAYANGTHRFTFHRGFDGPRYQIEPIADPGDSEGRFERRAWVLLNRFLPVRNASVVEREAPDGTTVFQVDGAARRTAGPDPPKSIVIVEPSGLVRRFTLVYGLPDRPGASLSMTVEYDHVGRTTVEPPGWYADVRNGSLNRSFGGSRDYLG